MLLTILFLVSLVSCKSILLTNDDSWVSTNIRAAYRDLTKAGYDVLLVAPVSQRSSWGGRFQIPSSKTLETDGEFGYVKAGSPSWGHEENDQHIWYFNGTPSSCVAFTIDYLLQSKEVSDFGTTIDLVVSGPNEDPNLLPGFYTNSGTMAAAYTALYRGIPAISFSGSDTNNSFFKDSLNTDLQNPANIYATKIVDLVDKYFNASNPFPPTTGLNVNFPPVGHLNSSCEDPKWTFTKLMGTGVFQQGVKYDSSSELLQVDIKYVDNIESLCIYGDCSLRAEHDVFLEFNCESTVSVFSIDYDANADQTDSVKKLLGF